MADKDGIYKCSICGNVVECFEAYAGILVCCGKNMDKFDAKAEEEGTEKHKPVVTIEGNKVIVKVGEVPHPMDKEHFIELIEIMGGDEVIASARCYPGQPAEAEFNLEKSEGVSARAYCNVHGLWKSE